MNVSTKSVFIKFGFERAAALDENYNLMQIILHLKLSGLTRRPLILKMIIL